MMILQRVAMSASIITYKDFLLFPLQRDYILRNENTSVQHVVERNIIIRLTLNGNHCFRKWLP